MQRETSLNENMAVEMVTCASAKSKHRVSGGEIRRRYKFAEYIINKCNPYSLSF
jgi:hypothetical protein